MFGKNKKRSESGTGEAFIRENYRCGEISIFKWPDIDDSSNSQRASFDRMNFFETFGSEPNFEIVHRALDKLGRRTVLTSILWLKIDRSKLPGTFPSLKEA